MRSSQGGRIDLDLSVGPRPSRASCLRFSRNCKVAETSNLVSGNIPPVKSNQGSKFEVQRSKAKDTENSFAHIFVKSGSIYVKARPK